ncbi:MAG: SAM-dependent methyltransferase, partial [Bacteroidota bacterium]|nr:SAM-dependent methyltransferase [Bacteroidota bacterium]
MEIQSSILYVVPTPIGNLADITHRSIDVLSKVELILCEDTRASQKLLKHYNIDTPTKSYHMHNEHRTV